MPSNRCARVTRMLTIASSQQFWQPVLGVLTTGEFSDRLFSSGTLRNHQARWKLVR